MSVTATQRILSEDVLTTRDACEELRPVFGKPIDRTTLYRWCLKGIQGTKLEHTKIGGRIVTSRQAITRFIESRSEDSTAATPNRSTKR